MKDLFSPCIKRKSMSIVHEGKTTTIRELCDQTGISYIKLLRRYAKGRRDAELVSMTPLTNVKYYDYKGQKLPIKEIALLENKSVSQLRSLYRRYGAFDDIEPRKHVYKNAMTFCTIGGVEYKIRDLVKALGVSRQAIYLQYHKKSEEDFITWVQSRMGSGE